VKNILIIYPHWPPSNLVRTLRPKFISNEELLIMNDKLTTTLKIS